MPLMLLGYEQKKALVTRIHALWEAHASAIVLERETARPTRG